MTAGALGVGVTGVGTGVGTGTGVGVGTGVGTTVGGFVIVNKAKPPTKSNAIIAKPGTRFLFMFD